MTPLDFSVPCKIVSRDDMSPLSSCSNYYFQPISPDNTVTDGDDNDEEVCAEITSYHFVPDDPSDDDSMDLAPYPFTTTYQELDDYHQLEHSLGPDWSSEVACSLWNFEMRICSDKADDASSVLSEDNDDASSLPSDDGDNDPFCLEDSAFIVDERTFAWESRQLQLYQPHQGIATTAC